MEYLAAKTLISSVKGKHWFGIDFGMNIYKGCSHGCIYCDSRSECYRIDNFDRVRTKENAIEIIVNDLKRKRKKGVIGTGGMSDPYNPVESHLQLTREALKVINENHFGISIATKSPLVKRDIDYLMEIKKHSPVIIEMTITTADDELSKKIERNVPVTSERFKAIKELSDNGIYCGILLMPILPFINDTEENILEIIRLAKENGAKFIYPYFGVTLRTNQRDYFFQQLDRDFPGLKKRYWKTYGNQYHCNSPKAEHLFELFIKECERLDIHYKMSDIIADYQKGYGFTQLSLF